MIFSMHNYTTTNWSQTCCCELGWPRPCYGLKRSFSSWPEIEVGSWWPVASDKALALQLCRRRTPTNTESNGASKICIRRRKSTVHVYRRKSRHRIDTRGRIPETYSCGSLSQLWGITSRFPLTNHFALPERVCIWCISGSSHVCMHLFTKMDSTEEAYG